MKNLEYTAYINGQETTTWSRSRIDARDCIAYSDYSDDCDDDSEPDSGDLIVKFDRIDDMSELFDVAVSECYDELFSSFTDVAFYLAADSSGNGNPDFCVIDDQTVEATGYVYEKGTGERQFDDSVTVRISWCDVEVEVEEDICGVFGD